MTSFNISTYIKILLRGLNSNQTQTGQLIFRAFEMSEAVELRLNVTPAFITNLMKNNDEVPTAVRIASNNPAVITEVRQHFQSAVVPLLNQQLIGDTCEILLYTLKNDRFVPDKKFQAIKTLQTDLGVFLAECFLYALNRPNRQEKINFNELPLATVRVEDGFLHINNKAILLDQHLKVPDHLKKEELPYVRALLSAYTDAEHHTPITFEQLQELPEKYQNNFELQRQNYYQAESIHRGVRDAFSPQDYHQYFSDLKNELYDGVIDIAQEDYENGFERLKAVLKQSLRISLAGSELAQLSGLIKNSQRKGMCHLLVNDGRLTWVLQDEATL